jgi:hypothetical protein
VTAHPTTNPRGRCFISYRRTRLDEVRRIINALHDHGVPTWQDETNLPEEPFESAIRELLDDPNLASGLLWITPDVEDSDIIRGVEIPGLALRAERHDGFNLHPVLAGGLSYHAGAAVTRTHRTLSDFGITNVPRVHTDPASDDDAATVGRRVLQRRIARIHAATPPGEPLIVNVHSRPPASHTPDAALTVNLLHHFTGRHATPDSWARILAAFEAIAQALDQHAHGRQVHFRGHLALPAATALGATFLATRRMEATWLQHTIGRPDTPYSLTIPGHPSGFTITTRDGHAAARDLAVLVSVNHNVIPAFQASTNPADFRGTIHTQPPQPDNHRFTEGDFTHPGEPTHLAHAIRAELLSTRSRYGQLGDIHLYIAAPAGLAFLLGQLLNTLGPIHTYELASPDTTGHYQPAVTLTPSG